MHGDRTLASVLAAGSGDARLHAVLAGLAVAFARIGARLAAGAPADPSDGAPHEVAEVADACVVAADACVVASATRCPALAGLVSRRRAEPVVLNGGGRYLLHVDPLVGASGVDVNVAAGSVFSVVAAPDGDTPPTPRDHLRPGSGQVAAGYVLYGPATVLVLTLGSGVHVFTLAPGTGRFVLTRADVRLTGPAREVAVDVSRRRYWEPAVRRYVDECLAGELGPRRQHVDVGWVASPVADVHRILTRGGVLLLPRGSTASSGPGLLYGGAPMAFLAEQAGGAAGTGRERVLDVTPTHLHEDVPVIVGPVGEVERIERYHRWHNDVPDASPLYGERGLFRDAG